MGFITSEYPGTHDIGLPGKVLFFDFWGAAKVTPYTHGPCMGNGPARSCASLPLSQFVTPFDYGKLNTFAGFLPHRTIPHISYLVYAYPR